MIIVHIVEPFAAGVALFVRSLTDAMPDDTHIIVHGERKKEITAQEVKKIFSNKNTRFIKWRSAQRSLAPVKDFLAFSELYKILKRLKGKNLVDVVHLHSSKSGLLGRIACRMNGIENVFYTPNGASFLSARYGITKYFYQQIEKFGDRIGGSVICCSASELKEYQRLGINAGFINNGTTIKAQRKFIKDPADKKFRIVTSGRIENQKNPSLFNSIAKYFGDMEQFEFIWIGDGSDKELLTSKNIVVTGWLNTDEVHEYVSAAHIYISTSKYEGLSFAVLEALALGKPVLLTNCTGNTDIVKRSLNGDLFKSKEDAIVKILQYQNNPQMLEVMGDFSAEICKTEFDVNENFKHYRKLYEGSNVRPGHNTKWVFTQ